MIALCAVLSGGQTAVDMAVFAEAKQEFLGNFLQLKNGVPSHDTFSRVFRQLVRTRATTGKAAQRATKESAYYLLSTALSPERLGQVVRSHWGVENRLHWVLNVVMNEDQGRSRMDNSPYNLAILRHMALNLMHKDRSNVSLRGKFNLAGWKEDFLAKLLAQA